LEETDEPRDASTRYGLLALYAAVLGLLFVAHRWHAPEDPWQIVIPRAQVEARIQLEADLRGAPLSAAERRGVVETLAEEAVLLREAERRRLDRGDPLIRGPLLGGVVAELAGAVPAPTDAEIRAWYDAEPERYARPPTLTLEQAVFDSSSAETATADADRILARLDGGEAPGAMGAIPGLPSRLIGQSRYDLLVLYGSAFTKAVLAIQDEMWHGPIESTMGTHYVRVAARELSTPQSFDEVRSYVREDVERARMRAAAAGQIEALRERYEVVIRGDVR